MSGRDRNDSLDVKLKTNVSGLVRSNGAKEMKPKSPCDKSFIHSNIGTGV